jgi:hypothetical protein
MSAGRQMGGHFTTHSLDEHGHWKNLTQQKNSSSDISPTAGQMPRLLGLAQASKIYRKVDGIDTTKFSVEGNESTREQFIINSSSLIVGRQITYPGEDISDAIKRLFRSGLFSDVEILISEKTSVEISLIIKVTEKPRLIEYKIEGVKRSQRKDLEDLIVITPGVAITDGIIAKAKNTILRFYKEKGYWYTKVDAKIVEAKNLENKAEDFEYQKFKKYNPEFWDGYNIIEPNAAIKAFTAPQTED